MKVKKKMKKKNFNLFIFCVTSCKIKRHISRFPNPSPPQIRKWVSLKMIILEVLKTNDPFYHGLLRSPWFYSSTCDWLGFFSWVYLWFIRKLSPRIKNLVDIHLHIWDGVGWWNLLIYFLTMWQKIKKLKFFFFIFFFFAFIFFKNVFA